MTGIDRLTLAELADRIAGEWARFDENLDGPLFTQARSTCRAAYGDSVFLRGLIELSSYCKQDCYYCGLRRSNGHVRRYRLTREEILNCCDSGYDLGFRAFVLQGGEDAYFDDGILCALVSDIKTRYPDCAVTLSLGERSRRSYEALFAAGVDRYLLRHETATASHFARLHPPGQTLASRKRSLYDLREIGFQVGAGFMVGSPGQTVEHLAADLVFLRDLQPHMVGIGPFLPHHETPFAGEPAGSLRGTLVLLALTRLLLPDALLPATTALGSLHSVRKADAMRPGGRELGLRAGANVVMPNLSPAERRELYSIYDGKLSSGAEAGEGLADLCVRIRGIGLRPDLSRGDHSRAGAKSRPSN